MRRDGSTLLPVWTGESAMSKQACLFGLSTHTRMHTDPDIPLCVAGEQVAQRTPVAARWPCDRGRYAGGSLV